MSTEKYIGQVYIAKDIAFSILGSLVEGMLLYQLGLVAYDHDWANCVVLSADRKYYTLGSHKLFPDLVLTLEGDKELNIEFQTNQINIVDCMRFMKYFLVIMEDFENKQLTKKIEPSEYPTVKLHIVASQKIGSANLEHEQMPYTSNATVFYLGDIDVEKELSEIQSKMHSRNPACYRYFKWVFTSIVLKCKFHIQTTFL
jgi:hypothetical protein